MSTNSPVQVLVSDRFIRDIRYLTKGYRGIRLDIQPFIGQLEGPAMAVPEKTCYDQGEPYCFHQ